MSGRVVFSLTLQQARALVAIRAGERFDASGVAASLLKRELAEHRGGLVLTPLGDAAAAVAARLAL